jgi:hypothetical protein
MHSPPASRHRAIHLSMAPEEVVGSYRRQDQQ